MEYRILPSTRKLMGLERFILLTEHSNCVPKLHRNLQKKSAFGESVHEAKTTILVNDHETYSVGGYREI